jgi:hypothetical protein
MRIRVAAALFGAVLLAPARGRAADPPPPLPDQAPKVPTLQIRTGEHPGFGRLVFDVPPGTVARFSREGGQVSITFDAPIAVAAPDAPPRNVRAIEGGAGRARFELAPGATVRQTKLGDRLVIDVLDPQAAQARAPSRGPSPGVRSATAADPLRPPAPTPPPPAPSAAPVDAPAPASAPTTPSPTEHAAPVRTVTAEDMPDPTRSAPEPIAAPAPAAAAASAPSQAEPLASMAAPVADPDGPGFDIPAAAGTGAAAFRRGDLGMVVLDSPRPVDLSGLRDDPVLGAVAARLLPEALVITLRLPPERALRLASRPGAWRVLVVAARAEEAGASSAPAPLVATVVDRRIDISTPQPGRVVTLSDPLTGGALLVGTLRGDATARPGQASGGAPGIAMPVARRMPGLALLPTWRGVAVEPLSDDLALRPIASGFSLEASSGLALAPPQTSIAALQDAAALTRVFDIPTDSPDALMRRMEAEIASAAAAPPLARGRARLAAAQTMIALGLGAEAASVLRLAQADDPRLAADPRTAQLAAAAALLSDRAEAADALAASGASSDELSLWRAVRAAMLAEGDPAAASGFAATLPLLRAYPDGLRARLLPLAAETMAAGGQPDAAASLLGAVPDSPALTLARGMLAQVRGDTEAALRRYDQLAATPDLRLRVRAGMRAVALRQATGRIAPLAAADSLDKLLPLVAGEPAALPLRLRIAALRAEAGAWRPALAVLRAGERDRPEDAPALRVALARIFTDMAQGDRAARLAPFEFVALLDENADLVPDGPAREALSVALADRLVALDLPARADPLLERLMRGAAGEEARARVGLRLAALRLESGRAADALAALAASASSALPAPLAAERTVLLARATAASGNPDAALAALDSLDTREAEAARVDILEQARDWAGAAKLLSARAAREVPGAGPLDDGAQRFLLRLAQAQARAGDTAGLAATRARAGTRIAGATGDLFRVLTAEPVRDVGDLSRAREEAGAAARVPDGLRALTRVAHAP